MRKVDITDKLTFDSNPALVIKGKELEINADAPSVLKVMGLMGGEEPSPKEILEAYDILLPDKSKKEIEKLKLSFQDLMTVVEEAIGLIIEEGEQPGEQRPVL